MRSPRLQQDTRIPAAASVRAARVLLGSDRAGSAAAFLHLKLAHSTLHLSYLLPLA